MRSMAAAAPTFSYAQAAKGEAPQAPPTPPSKTEPSGPVPAEEPTAVSSHPSIAAEKSNTDHEGHQLHQHVQEPVPTSTNKPSTTQSASEEGKTQSSEADTPKPSSTELAHTADDTPGNAGGPAAAAPEVAGAATPNESDSAWEKVSQASQSDTKGRSKSESDNEDLKLSSWEHVPPAKQLKEAPPPAFNIWHKRAADAKTKVGEPKSSPNPSLPASSTDSVAVPHKRVNESQVDTTTRRRGGGNSRQNPDDRAVHASRDGALASASPQSTAMMTASSVSLPPPATDATSWPTPESAKDEDKKRTVDRSDKTDKSETDKTPNKHHGKDKWVQMPYVPTAVFNTPLPGARRGGRAARGSGREALNRGGAHAAVNGGDRTPNGSAAPVASSTAAPSSTRGDMGPPRPGPLPSKAKRASSAGPSSSVESRRTGEGLNSTPNPNPRPIAADGRRITSGQQASNRQWPPSSRINAPEADSMLPPSSMYSEAPFARTSSQRHHDSPKAGDANGHGPQRERGEHRSDRGRGGYRGRGNFGTSNGPHHASGQGFAPNSNQPSSYGPMKSQTYSSDPRREPMPAQTSFLNQREPRHSRNSSRSQSIPTPGFNRYQSGPQHLPQLHTDTANMYYSQGPTAVMSAVPYPGYMEHMQLAGLVQMQM